MESPSRHVSVLPREVLDWIAPQPGGVYVDGTFGGGGHSQMIAERVGPQGLVVGLDRDPAAIEAGRARMAGLPVRLAVSDFADLPEVLAELELNGVDGIVLDLGISSDQLDDPDRGFSFTAQAPLDLRFNPQVGEPAWRLVQRLSEKDLADLIYQYGEERLSRRIARRIVWYRRREPLRTAGELARVIAGAVPGGRHRQRIHPATRAFQALRIAVNDELGSLARAVKVFPDCLRPGGRAVIISFHSLEDRIVKWAFRDDSRYLALTKKPIQPTEGQRAENPRCRSARLRVAERTADAAHANAGGCR